MGLKGRQITDFQLKIRDPWRFKVWPNETFEIFGALRLRLLRLHPIELS